MAFSQTFDEPVAATQVRTSNGVVEGIKENSGIISFKGIPFAAPPVGNLRWKETQPVKNWSGVLKANKFGPRAMQKAIFGDMNFRSNGMSEDCLYLNVWTPEISGNEKLPVLVYFYGGGFMAGDGSEPRYDGESMATKGILSVTMNYRLGAFGFMAHPELSEESKFSASGNYGLLDQYAALEWVIQNISAFGGDPSKVTIAGESAGSYSVSAQMASPLSKGLIAGAIGQSGSLLSLNPPLSLKQSEALGVQFSDLVEAENLSALRAMPAEQILEATAMPQCPTFSAIVDGYFFPKLPLNIYEAGEQAMVPLLGGWNSEEMNYKSIFGTQHPTPENYKKIVKDLYGDQADAIFKLYPGKTEAEVIQSATDLAGDRFIGYSTWKWLDVHAKTSKKPVFQYYYTRPRPEMTPEMGDASPGLAGGVVNSSDATAMKVPPALGAVHSAEIEYALGNLSTNKVFNWKKEDYKVSEIMQGYFANFIKTGNPNGKGLPEWPAASSSKEKEGKAMYIDVDPKAKPGPNTNRFLLLEKAEK
ncbi:MAG: carboxylesterase family protein [Bacteroidota bacterium]|nr:carboxylesterase family protein [Bacteroidota bacterium]